MKKKLHCGPPAIDQDTKGDIVAVNNTGILCRLQLSTMHFSLAEQRGEKKDPRRGSNSNNDSVSCKEKGRKEETERWREVEGGL